MKKELFSRSALIIFLILNLASRQRTNDLRIERIVLLSEDQIPKYLLVRAKVTLLYTNPNIRNVVSRSRKNIADTYRDRRK